MVGQRSWSVGGIDGVGCGALDGKAGLHQRPVLPGCLRGEEQSNGTDGGKRSRATI